MRRALLCLGPVAILGASNAAAAEPTTAIAIVATAKESLLLFAVTLDGKPLSDALPTIGEANDPLVPVGELSRLLHLNVDVEPARGRVIGHIGDDGEEVSLDSYSLTARRGTVSIGVAPGDFELAPTDIYVRASLLEKLLPIAIKVDQDDLSLALAAKETLPIEAERERADRLRGLAESSAPDATSLEIDNPYGWLSFPAFDVSAEMGSEGSRGGMFGRLEARFAMDALRTNVTGFVETDDRGTPETIRLKTERRSPAGNLLGPLHATLAAAGDIFLPALSLGAGSVAGAGVVVSTAPLDQANVFDRISVHGELRAGYDVELYVNGILRAGQNDAREGRYAFNDITLVRGVNILRIVSYGPRGERSEETKVINVDGGLVERGRTVLDAGFVWQDDPVIAVGRRHFTASRLAHGEPRAVFSLAHGLTSTITGHIDGALFADLAGERHRLLTGGLRTTLGAFAIQLDHSHDFGRGSASLIGVAGNFAGIALAGKHIEYGGDFTDENIHQGRLAYPMNRYSELTFDMELPLSLPLSGRLEHSEFADGAQSWTARVRTSTSLGSTTLMAIGADYTQREQAAATEERLNVNFAMSRVVAHWQLRASLDLRAVPTTDIRSMALTADRAVGGRHSLRLGLAQSFGEYHDLAAQAGWTSHLPFGDASLVGGYSTKDRRWRAALQLSFGLAPAPELRRYHLTPPGPSQGGSASLDAYLDDNANGRRDPGEVPLAGVVMRAGPGNVASDETGHAFVTGLGDSALATMRIDASDVDGLMDASLPQDVRLYPRPGVVTRINYPVVPTSEVVAKVSVHRPDGQLAGLSLVRLRLVREDGVITEGVTEFDGAAVFDQVTPGRYTIEIASEQADRLGMRFARPATFIVRAGGGPVAVAIEVAFEHMAVR